MSIRKAQFPGQIWDGTAADRDTRLIDASPLYPTYDQVVAELIATQQYAQSLGANPTPPSDAEAAENLTAGNPVYLDASGHLMQARNDMVAGAQVAGLASADALATETGLYVTDGATVLPDWTAIIGTQYLTPGAVYYLGDTPGTMTETAPTTDGYYVVPLGRALTTTKFDIEIGQPIRL